MSEDKKIELNFSAPSGDYIAEHIAQILSLEPVKKMLEDFSQKCYHQGRQDAIAEVRKAMPSDLSGDCSMPDEWNDGYTEGANWLKSRIEEIIKI